MEQHSIITFSDMFVSYVYDIIHGFLELNSSQWVISGFKRIFVITIASHKFVHTNYE